MKTGMFSTGSVFVISLLLVTGCGGGGSSAPSNNSPENNNAPTATSVSILDVNGGNAEAGDVLSGIYIFSDTEGDSEGTSTFRWLHNGIVINGETSLTYTISPADISSEITFEITPIASTGSITGVAVVSGGLNVTNAFPVASQVTITDDNGGSPKAGDTLTGSYTYTDNEGDAEGTSTFRWLRNGVLISGETASTYVLTLADNGLSISFEVTPVATTGSLAGISVESAGLIGNRFPVASFVIITDNNGGSAVVGDILTGSYTYSDPEDDVEGNSTYRWLRNGVAITGETTLTYTLTNEDSPSLIAFEVLPVAATGSTPGNIVTTGNIEILNLAPVASVGITDDNSGDVIVGDTLTASYLYSDNEDDPESTSGFQWLRNGLPISEERAVTYVLQFSDAGQSIAVEVTPIAATGTRVGEVATSDPIEVNAVPSAINLTLTDNNAGDIVAGDTLTGSYTYSDAENDLEGISTFRWLRNGIEITGETALTYIVVPDDNGQSLSFEVTPVALTGSTIGRSVKVSSSNASHPLNDTGITGCGDYAYVSPGPYPLTSGSNISNNDLDCASQPVVPTQSTDGSDTDGDMIRGGQDALYGRDFTHNDNTDGHAGFSFTKLDSTGIPLTDQTQDYATNPWACVRDNVTGLIWEVKTTSGLQSNTHMYTWYSQTFLNNGRDHGIGDTGVGTTTGYELFPATLYAGSDNCSDSARCDIEKYVEDINALNICGETTNDWRMPGRHELLSIVNNNRTRPTVDVDYFPNIRSSFYWSGSSHANQAFNAWYVNFQIGSTFYGAKDTSRFVRLVRDAAQQ